MISYSIQQAVPANIPALKQLISDSVRHLNAPDYTAQQIESALQHIYGVDSQLIEDGTYYVAVQNGRLIGCGGWSKRKTLYGGDQAKAAPDEDTLLDPKTDAAKIRAFFVLPHFARQGIGRALMSVSETAAYQAGFKKLELMATLTGEPLYAASGFEVLEQLTLTLPDGARFPVTRMRKIAAPILAETNRLSLLRSRQVA